MPMGWYSGSAVVAGFETSFTPTHREDNDTPVAFEVTVTVPMSIEDAAALMWIVVNGGMTFAELDDVYVHELIAETLVAHSGEDLRAAWEEMTATKPGTPEHVIAAEVLRRAREVFAPAGRTRRPVCAAPRELAAAR